MIPPKRFDIFFPLTGGCSEGLDAFRFFFEHENIHACFFFCIFSCTGRPGSSEVPRNPLTRWDVSSIPANGIFLTKKLKNKDKNAQRVEND